MFARLPAELLSNMVATTEFLYLFYFFDQQNKTVYTVIVIVVYSSLCYEHVQ